MKQIAQDFEELLQSLTEMEADWIDGTSKKVLEAIARLPKKLKYTRADVTRLLDEDFSTGLTLLRLFLGISKDELESKVSGLGQKGYQSDPENLLSQLVEIGILEKMTETANRPVHWSDILVERLRMGRGRAVKGQARGRSLEDFVEETVRRVFGDDGYDVRCTFTGVEGKTAKADFAIPDRTGPRIVIESKGYGATGSKQTDVLGDLEKIVKAKRPDTALIFVTDGLTWNRRQNDFRKIVAMQHRGDVARVYTRALQQQMERDLRTLKREFEL